MSTKKLRTTRNSKAVTPPSASHSTYQPWRGSDRGLAKVELLDWHYDPSVATRRKGITVRRWFAIVPLFVVVGCSTSAFGQQGGGAATFVPFETPDPYVQVVERLDTIGLQLIELSTRVSKIEGELTRPTSIHGDVTTAMQWIAELGIQLSRVEHDVRGLCVARRLSCRTK